MRRYVTRDIYDAAERDDGYATPYVAMRADAAYVIIATTILRYVMFSLMMLRHEHTCHCYAPLRCCLMPPLLRLLPRAVTLPADVADAAIAGALLARMALMMALRYACRHCYSSSRRLPPPLPFRRRRLPRRYLIVCHFADAVSAAVSAMLF